MTREKPTPTVEISAGGFVVSKTDSSMVALMARFNRGGKLEGCIPKGHLEPGESNEQAALRELFEETGLALQADGWLGISQLLAANGHRYVRVNFYFEPNVLPERYQPQDTDILALHWLNLGERAEHALPERSQLVSDAIIQYQQGVRLPLALIKSPVSSVSASKTVL
jgi:phosphatase NudJ